MVVIEILCYGRLIINGLCSNSLTNFVGTIVRLLEFVRIGLGRLRFAIQVVYFREDGGFWLVLLVFWNIFMYILETHDL